MLRPSIFGETLFDDFMDGFRFPEFPEIQVQVSKM